MRLTASSLLFGAIALTAIGGVLTAPTDGPASSAQYFVKFLPGQPKGPLIKMHAGHIEVDAATNGNLFFWHFQNKHIANRQRTVIWLNGGPGCSSMDGTLMEIGPYRVKEDQTLEENPGSWHEFANLLFVDQPVGTGFSYVDSNHYLTDLDQMADHFIRFLEKWFALFPEYEADDLYIAGESYAGQHIPYIAQAILDRNAKSSSATKWKIEGLLIGNGWIDPTPQYLSYLTFAYKEGIVEAGSDVAKSLEKQVSICAKTLSEKGANHVDVPICERILTDLLEKTKKMKNGVERCVNMYDVRLDDTYPSCGMNWPPDLKDLTPYLRKPDVVKALNINPGKKSGWTECAGGVSSAFRARNSKPSIELMPNLLANMPVLLFSGDKDLICNHIGTEELIHAMEFNGGKGFELDAPGTWAPREDWVFEGEPAGYYQSARNLTYVLFYNSSHMVPFDFPRRTRDMIDRFMGVDIGKIGGIPTDSIIGGEKGPVTSVGGTPNSTTAIEKEKSKVDKARWDAYYRSGEIALVFVAISAIIWGIFVYRQRRSYRNSRNDGKGAYRGVGIGMKRRNMRSEESFDEDELKDLTVETPMFERDPESGGAARQSRYSVGSDESDGEGSAAKERK
ncbi:pheromone-processing carboxypeptidase KEX1 [Morchella snyderi]|nr:pheromone-processing carboxypeptidase KEX1 [Morchella snyderi]